MRAFSALVSAVAALLVAVGCTASPAAERALTVFAAASLADVFVELGGAFSAEHPGVEVAFNFAGSQTLASQIAAGARADVFASANEVRMKAVAASGGLAGDAVVFATNELAIAVERGNPRRIRNLGDLAHPDLVVVLPAPHVPAGEYARQSLARAGVDLRPVALEQHVRGALSRVELGEADAAIVYASDLVAASGRVAAVTIPAEHNVAAAYFIARLADAPHPGAAAAFVEFVRSPRAQQVLRSYGFTAP